MIKTKTSIRLIPFIQIDSFETTQEPSDFDEASLLVVAIGHCAASCSYLLPVQLVSKEVPAVQINLPETEDTTDYVEASIPNATISAPPITLSCVISDE